MKSTKANAPQRASGIRKAARLATLCAALLFPTSTFAQLTGEIGAHDPSTLARVNSTYYYFATGQGIATRTSTNLASWSSGPSVFASPPSWTTTAVPSFTGHFWAPDVAYFNGKYHLYYSVSSWGTIDSAIGVVTTPSLSNPTWTDQGKVVQSDATWEAGPNTDTTSFNAIDPSILVDSGTGRVWMAFGSYSSGILVTEINPSTGKRMNTSSLNATLVANNAPGGGWGSSVEGAALIQKNGFYYLFVNYGGCCAGVDSTYNIRVGRSTSPTGPFLDKNGVNLTNSGGTMFLDDEGNKIGPGHFSLFSEAGQDKFGYHYYDGNRNGAPTYGLHNLYWTADAWPSVAAVNPNWTGTSSTVWSNASNWSDGVPDAAGAVANFRSVTSNRYAIAVDGAARTLATLNFDSTSTYTIGNASGNGLTLDEIEGTQATINVASGSHLIGAPITALDQLGINVTPSGSTLSLLGSVAAPSLQTYGNGSIVLAGANAYSGTVLVHDGTLTVSGSVQAGQYMSVGAVQGDGATLRVIGSGSLQANDDLNIGDTGDGSNAATGTLELRDSASVTVGAAGGFFVGSGYFANTRATGTVNQSGGTLTVNASGDGNFIVGGRTSTLATGVYNLTGGTVNANTNLRIGGRGNGTMNQTGGTFNAAAYLSIGRYGSSTGAWNISSGTLNHTNAATQIIVGESGTGSLTISGSAQVTTPAAVRLGHATGGSGTLNLNGGVLTAAAIQRGPGTGTVRFDGGTLRAAGASTTFMQGLTGAVITTGGAILDSNSFNLTIAQALLHDGSLVGADGGLTKIGTGQLTLSGANTFTGATTLNSGSLRLSANSQNVLTNAGGLVINAGSVTFDHAVGSSLPQTIRSLLASGSASGFASGQIRSGALESGEALGWKSVGSTQVLVALTKLGDANLDLAVNFDDLLTLAQNYGTTGVWGQGDFTYDGLVNFDDLLLLAQQYGSTAVNVPESFSQTFRADWSLARSLVPEPGLAAVFASLLVLTRRTVRH